MRQQLRLHASHGPHPGEEHRKDGNSGYRFRIFANEWACEAFYRQGCQISAANEKEEMPAGLDRIDIEMVTAEHRGESRDIEWRCGGPKDGRQKRDRDVEPEYSGEGDAGWTHGD